LAQVEPLLPRAAPLTTSALAARLSRPLPLELRLLISCSAVTMPCRSRSCRVITCTGSAPSAAMRLMLLPVISTRCGVVPCARADEARPIRARAETSGVSRVKVQAPGLFVWPDADRT
jgi:hypothetical protein